LLDQFATDIKLVQFRLLEGKSLPVLLNYNQTSLCVYQHPNNLSFVRSATVCIYKCALAKGQGSNHASWTGSLFLTE
jgi:hypothetical protein